MGYPRKRYHVIAAWRELILKTNLKTNFMPTDAVILQNYALNEADVNLITFALRRFSETTMFSNLRDETTNLIEYIERETKEKKSTKQ